MKSSRLNIIPLGGVGEIGKNMMVIEGDQDILVIDTGLMFPDDDMLGVDLVIPDIRYLIERKEKIKGIVLTHAHEDHIGALPFILTHTSAPLYGTKLTLGIAEERLKDSKLPEIDFRYIQPGKEEKMGEFAVEFFRVNHSIPDGVGLAIHTPLGLIIHSGDFKIDQTPMYGEKMDLRRLAELGRSGVLLFICDCLNVEKEGYTPSERVVRETLTTLFKLAKGRIIIATFASNIQRIQQIMEVAFQYKKKVAVAGKSMLNIMHIAEKLGYLYIPENILIKLDEVSNYPLNRIVLLATGTQGEPMSALTRMARDEYRGIKITPGDTVIISANPIPGNETAVSKTVNELFRRGAKVIYEADSLTHVSGHASQEELKLMLNLLSPSYVLPFHGEYRHLVRYAQLAEEVGIVPDNIFIAHAGDLIQFTPNKVSIMKKVAEEKILIDGLSEIDNVILKDRRELANDGIFIICVVISKEKGELLSEPEIISRGFVCLQEEEELLKISKDKIKEVINEYKSREVKDWMFLREDLNSKILKFLYQKTKRRPQVFPIVMEV